MKVFLQVTHKKDYEQNDYFTYSYLAKKSEKIETKYADFLDCDKEDDVEKAWLNGFLKVNQWLISNEIKEATIYVKGKKNKRFLKEALKKSNDYTRELKRLSLFIDFEIKTMKEDSEEVIEILNELERNLHHKRTLHQRILNKLIKQNKLEEEEVLIYQKIQEEIHDKINFLMKESQKTKDEIFKYSFFSKQEKSKDDVSFDKYKYLKMLQDNYDFLEDINSTHFKGEAYEEAYKNELESLNDEIDNYKQTIQKLEGDKKKKDVVKQEKEEEIEKLTLENEELKKKLERLTNEISIQSTETSNDVDIEIVHEESTKIEIQKFYEENKRFHLTGISRIMNNRYFLSHDLMSKVGKGTWLNKSTMDEELNEKINKTDMEWLYLKVFYYSLKELIEKNILNENETQNNKEKPLVLHFVLPKNHYKNEEKDLEIIKEMNSSHLKELYNRSNEEIEFLNEIKELLIENNVTKVRFELK